MFDNLIFPYLNVRLRNAIGHYTYKVDQIITYFPSGNEKIENPPTMSIVDFVQCCWNIFQSLINFAELVYQTRKIIYLKQGLEPSFEHIFQVQNRVISKKIINKSKVKRKSVKSSKRTNRKKK